MTDIKDIFRQEDDVDRLMKEKGCDRETAWSIIQERKEQEKIAEYRIQHDIEEMDKKPLPKPDCSIIELPTVSNKNDYYIEDEKGVPRFKAPLLAHDICFNGDKNRGIRITDDNKKIIWFNGRYWQDNGEEVIKNIIQQILGDSTCQKHKNEVIGWIKDCLALQVTREELDSDKYKIGLQNGVYDLQTQTLLPFDEKYFITKMFPLNHNKLATCPIFLKFLPEILEESDILVIQEMFGYCFIKDYPLAVMFFLVGVGRNGKSTLLNVLIRMLGKENVSNVPIQSLCDDNFSGIDLYHKYANIVCDLSTKELDHTGKLKQLCGNDYIRARDLYEKSMKFKSYAKLINAMNEIPVCHDKTLAWMQRCACIEFPNQFLDGAEGTDKNLIDKLTTPEEIEGIFLWAMEGYQRIQEKGAFSPHKNLDDMVKFMAQTKNSILQFVKAHIREKTGNEILKDTIFQNFVKYCLDNKYASVSSNHFSNKFKQYIAEQGIHYEEGQSKILKGRVWKNIEYCDTESNREDTPEEMSLAKGKDKQLIMDGWEAAHGEPEEVDHD
jgi:putative DNA primase/helicase